MSPDSNPPGCRRPRLLIPGLLLGVLVGVLVVAGFVVFGSDDTPTRQEMVAQRGSKVMPFDLNATKHQFDITASGAVETVTASGPDDPTMRSALADWVMAQNMDHGTGMNHG